MVKKRECLWAGGSWSGPKDVVVWDTDGRVFSYQVKSVLSKAPPFTLPGTNSGPVRSTKVHVIRILTEDER